MQFRLAQDSANRDAIGAWVEVRCAGTVLRREITIGGGHAGGHLGWMHFGLGDATRKPNCASSGRTARRATGSTVAANGFYVVERGKPPIRWQPK